MDFKLFDSHCHLYFPQFDKDRGAVLAQMEAEGVGAVVIGTDLATSKAAIELAEKHDFLFASVGLHPNDSPSEVYDAAAFEELAKHPKVVAIGECGLDYYRSSGEGQQERFEAQIALAKKFGKALVVHCRDAHEDMLDILAIHKPNVPVIIHFFTGLEELAQKYLDLGCYLSFPGPVTFTDMYDESMKVAPSDKILVETDAPFAAPTPYRGKRNEPRYVAEVVRKIATLKGLSEAEVTAATVQNALRAFSLPPH